MINLLGEDATRYNVVVTEVKFHLTRAALSFVKLINLRQR
jgi:hypothetical protein